MLQLVLFFSGAAKIGKASNDGVTKCKSECEGINGKALRTPRKKAFCFRYFPGHFTEFVLF